MQPAASWSLTSAIKGRFLSKIETSCTTVSDSVTNGIACLTWASRCWLSGSPGLAMDLLVSSTRLPDLSRTSPAQSSMALHACGSSVVEATPRAAEARERRAWATSRAAMPVQEHSAIIHNKICCVKGLPKVLSRFIYVTEQIQKKCKVYDYKSLRVGDTWRKFTCGMNIKTYHE